MSARSNPTCWRLLVPGRLGALFAALLVSSLLAGWAALAAAQLAEERYNFTHYTLADGLPQSQIFAIHQDEKGYLWVGTWGGLARYNGRRFDRYTTADGLSGNQIEAIVDDPTGRLWIGTNEGACTRIAATFDCTHHPDLDASYVHVLLAAPEAVWIGTNRGLFRASIPGGEVTDHSRGLPHRSVLSLARFGDALWVGTEAGLARIPGDGGAVSRLAMPAESTRVTALLAGDARLWIGTSRGLYRFDGDALAAAGPEAVAWMDAEISALAPDPEGGIIAAGNRGVVRIGPARSEWLDSRQGLANDIAHSLLVDRERMIWIGLDTGLDKLAPTRFFGYDKGTGLLADFVRTLAQDAAGRIWLGTRVGVQIAELDGRRLDLRSARILTAEDGLLDERTYSIVFPEPGQALIATSRGVAHWYEGDGITDVYTADDGLPSDLTRSLLVAPDGRIWIGTVAGVAVMEDGRIQSIPDQQLAEVYPLRIRAGTDGRIWFATRDHGLMILDPDGGVERLTGDNGLSDQTLWDLAPDAGGDGMWVGSNGDGLFHVRGDGTIEQFTERDGLVNDFVWQVLRDRDGNVWAYTNRGLSRHDGRGFENFDLRDGLLHLEGGATGGLQTRDGQLWFASAGGLMRYDPGAEFRNRVPPPVVIERAAVDGRPVKRGARLPWNHSGLDFEFAALSFHREADVRYRYRLLGLGRSWSEPRAYRPVSYGRLDQGEYVFEVTAANADGVWSRKPARFAFSVAAPLWARGWFQALVALLLAGLAWLAVQLRLRSLQRRGEWLEHLVAERTRELEAANRRLRRASTTDPLTGLDNRRFLLEQIRRDVAHCRRQYRDRDRPENAAIVFLIIDLDNFKHINDSYGHQAGDRVLSQFGTVLRQAARQSDYVIRWGGDEFLVVARNASADEGGRIADRILERVDATAFSVDESGRECTCVCSIGVCAYPFDPRQFDALSWEQVVEIADAAAYCAKQRGGGRWVEVSVTGDFAIGDRREFLDRIREQLGELERDGVVGVRTGRACDNA